MTKGRWSTVWLLGALALEGCGADRTERASEVTDSAGIRIVTNVIGRSTQGPAWVVDSVPSRVFGRAAEDSASMLLHPVGAARLSDGRVVVGDRGSSSLKVFSSTGGFERSIGRLGDGPGEFRYLARLFACHADSVFADDIAHRHFSVMAPDGAIVRTFVLQTAEPSQPAYEITCNRHGDFLTSGWGSLIARQEAYRPQVPVSLAGPDGKVRVTLGQFPGTEMMPTRGGAGPRRMGRWLRLAMSRDFAWVAPNTTTDMLAFAPDGHLRMIVRTSGVDRSVSQEDLAWHRESALDSTQTEQAKAEVRRALEVMTAPEALPAVVRLLADSEGYLWVQRYPDPGQLQGRWDIYQPDGVLLAQARLPTAFFPVEIGMDYVLGLATSDDGSEWVQLHKLHRPGT